MTWFGETGFARRPVVAVEDHLHHVSELLDALAAPGLLEQVTVVCLDRPGPDTDRAVERWLAAFPGLQVAASWDGPAPPADPRFLPLDRALFEDSNRFSRAVAGLLRPGGLLIQDVQLSTLRFLPADRWWESIFLASTVRGMFADRPPACRFLSNKRGYQATFGRDLLEAGFDPRDVLDKSELSSVVVPVIRSFLERSFPLVLRFALGKEEEPQTRALARVEPERLEAERELDLVLWSLDPVVELGGRLIEGPPGSRVALKPGSQEAATWAGLLEDRLAGGDGLPVVEVGRRLAPEGAGKAEMTNLAARHLHVLRGRLTDGGAIVTLHHAYRLSDRLRIGRVTPRPKPLDS
jgi:hypothetical protein